MTSPTETVGEDRLREMLPCPFCGERRFARVRRYPWEKEGEPDLVWGFHVICDASGLDNWPRGCGSTSGWAETADEAAEAWNRRASIRARLAGDAPTPSEEKADG